MKTFSDFLSSGPAPDNFSAQADSLSFVNKNGKKFVLLYDDLEECLRQIWMKGENINRKFDGDWNYDEIKYRKAFLPILSSLTSNSVIPNLESQTPNTIKSLELYAGYRLGKRPNIRDDGVSLIQPESLEPLFSLKTEFTSWLQKETTLGENSIQKYTGAISGFLSKNAGKKIYSISDPSEYSDIRQLLQNSEAYKNINENGNSMYSSALKHYAEFLKQRSIPIIGVFNHSAVPETYTSYTLIPALLTKPFAILTGASGTGKTKLAESLADYLRNHDDRTETTNIAVVPVGADWTDNRNVLGFVNHLRDDGEDEKRPIYQSTPVLDLLLDADKDRRMPHFLILDEMNLSHVERYFADFLSVMEQRDGRLYLHDEGPRDDDDFRLARYSGDEHGVPRCLVYPGNFFVVGTVNIDETTYMFSPKVLDRANVIEFKVGHEEIEAFLADPHPYPEIEKADDGVAQSFLALATKARDDELENLPSAVHELVQAHLLALFDLMQEGRFEFAYRTANEVMRYLCVCRDLADDKDAWDGGEWQSDLDDQVLQKILPKLHGSIGRIGGLLANLADYCFDHSNNTDRDASNPHASSRLKEVAGRDSNDARFGKSFEKLQAMIRTLRDEQFVSFIQ